MAKEYPSIPASAQSHTVSIRMSKWMIRWKDCFESYKKIDKKIRETWTILKNTFKSPRVSELYSQY